MSSWGDLEDEVDGEKSVRFRVASNSSTTSNRPCCCELVYDLDEGGQEVKSDPLSYLKSSILTLEAFDGTKNSECLLNILCNACSVACLSSSSSRLNTNYKKHFADLYLRYRHEFFHSLVLKYLSLPLSSSDVRFCDVLDIDSTRTPDSIIQYQGKIHIIEVTVSTDYEKSLFKKGSSEHGYVPKYIEEINELVLKGKDVSYHVLVWDMSRLEANEYLQTLHTILDELELSEGEVSAPIFESYRKSMMSIHSMMAKNFSGEMSLALSSSNQFKVSPEELSNLSLLIAESHQEYSQTYTRLTVSPEIHTKFMNNFDRLPRFLANHFGSKSIILVYNIVSSKFFFEKDSKLGIDYKRWLSYFESFDYISIFTNTYIRSGGKLKESYMYDTGVDYFVLQSKTTTRIANLRNFPNYFYKHSMTGFRALNSTEDFKDEMPLFKSSHYDPEFEDNLITKILELDSMTDWAKVPDLGVKLLANCDVKPEIQRQALESYRLSLRSENEFNTISIPPKEFGFKNSFIFPLVDSRVIKYCNFREKPTPFLLGLRELTYGQGYTSEIINRCLGSFEFGSTLDSRLLTQEYQDAFHKRAVANSDYYQRLKKLTIDRGLLKMPKYNEALKMLPGIKALHDEMQEKNKEFEKYMRENNLPKMKIPLLKIPTKVNTLMFSEFKSEMSHFREKSKKGVERQMSYKKGYGNGNRQLETHLPEVNKNYENLVDFLMGPSMNKSPDNFIDTFVSDDVSFLKLLKNEHVDQKRHVIDYLRYNNLTNITSFVSRLCHTLMYYSQCSFSSEYVAVDNLGHSNALLIVKGGKKIFKTKASKLFRLFYPVCEEAIPFITDNKTTSYSVKIINGEKYCLTPWTTMHEAHLAEGISMNHKVNGFLLMNLGSKVDRDRLRLLMFNVMLALHGRRSTEELLHGVRYFIANNLGKKSNLLELMPSFSGFNRDVFQYMIRSNLSEKYLEFSTQISKWQISQKNSIDHIFCSAKINTPEDLTFLIYSTYLMTKAPITQGSEQVKNLRSIMKIHREISSIPKEKYNTTLKDKSFLDYSKELFENDMKLDLNLCSTIGKFCGDYLLSKNNESKLLGDWESILNKGWQTLANTKGLRGDKEKGKFFGEKGYYVALEKTSANENFKKCLEEIMSNNDELTKRKNILKMNETYRHQLSSAPPDLSFHAVDKRQRGGSREIYVMDLITKVHQQPIEAFMKKLCKLMPNEVISIPSNKRSHFVHSRVFEKIKSDEASVLNSFLTLDCRKWAPKSVLEKYVVFISSMSDVLPSSFVSHFLRFFDKMFDKKFVTRKAIYEIYVGSKSNESDSEYFTIIDDRAEMKMDYSFMMGIFNYLSSLMHAANQIYASYIINKTSKMKYGCPTDLTLLCHSDDSAGKMSTKNAELENRCLFLYEVLLKGCNHLLSIKKCSVSETYFEFLSILYYKNKLMPLLPKFLSGISFRPSDKGYSSDVISALNRSNELILNGSTFNNAYLAIKVQSHLIWKFYFNKDPNPSDYSRPIQLLGMPDPHPLSSMITGSDSELVRLYVTKGKDQFNNFYRLLTCLSVNFDSEESMMPTLIVKNPVVVSKPLLKNLIKLIKAEAPDFSESWTVSNVNFRNTYLDSIQVSLKCQDRVFVSAMQDEELTRRISRSYHYRSSSCVNTTYGNLSYKKLKELIDELILYLSGDKVSHEFSSSYLGSKIDSKLLQALDEDVKKGCENVLSVLEIMHGEYIHFLRYMDKINVDKVQTEARYNTCKPIHMLIQKTTQPLVKINDVSSLVSYIKEPQYRGLLPDLTNMPVLSRMIGVYFNNLGLNVDEMPPTLLYKLINKLNSNMSKEFYFYSNMPSNTRNIENYHDLCTFLAHNSFPDKQILGISLYFPNSVQHMSPEFSASMMSVDFKAATAFISILYNILRESFTNFEHFLGLTVEGECVAGVNTKLKVSELPNLIREKWQKNSSAYNFISPYVEIIIGVIDYRYTFDHSNRLVGDLNFLKNSYFYFYIKKQKLVGNKWLGDASIYVRAKDSQFVLDFNTVKLTSLKFISDKGPLENLTVSYLNYVLRENGMRPINDCLTPNPDRFSVDWMIGIDEFGVLQVNKCGLLDFTLSSSFLDPKIDRNMKLLNFHSCVISDEMSVEFTVGDELSDRTKVKTNFIKLDISRLQEVMLNTFLPDHEENKRIMGMISGPLKEQFNYYILKTMGMDLYIDFDDLLNDFTNSKLYGIMHHLEQRDLLPDPEERRPIYPAQEGGLLNLLIKSKETGFDIDMISESILTTHMLNMKSNNPESYLSTIYENLEIMYEKLYTPDMKLNISQDLSVIYKALVQGEDQSEKMQTLLRKWGLIGIEGNLVSYRMKKSPHFFNYFYVDGCNKTLSTTMSENLGPLLKGMLKVFSDNKNEARLVLENLGHTPEMSNFNHLKKLFNGAILLYSYTAGSRMFFPYCNYPYCFMVFYKMLEVIILDDELSSSLSSQLENSAILKVLPTDSLHLSDWWKVLTSLINSYLNNNRFKHSPRLTPKDKSNQFVRRNYLDLGGDPSFTMKINKYGGVYSSQLMSEICSKAVVKSGDKYYHFQPVLSNLSPKIFFDAGDLKASAPLNEDVLDSDEYEDMKLELSSNSPDLDEIERLSKEILSMFEDPYKYDTKIYDNRVTAKIGVLNLVGNSGYGLMKHIRQVAENIMIITDSVIDLKFSGCHTGVYRLKSEWSFPIICKENLIVQLVCKKGLEDKIAEGFFLEPTHIQQDERVFDINLTYKLQMSSKVYLNMDPSELSEITDKVELAGQIKLKDMQDDLESDEIPEEVEKDKDELVAELVSRGMDEKMAESISSYMKISNNCDLNMSSLLIKLSKDLESGEGLMSAVLNYAKETISSGLKNKEAVEDVLQVPLIFREGVDRSRGKRNNALRDQVVRAEINTISSGSADRIVSGNLVIDEETLDELLDIMDLCRSKLTEKPEDYNKKIFLNFMMFFLNDAQVVKDPLNPEDMEIWINFRKRMVKSTARRKSPKKEKLTVKPGNSTMRYKALAMGK